MSSQGTLEEKPKECKDEISSFEKWTDAMLILCQFMSHLILKMYELLHYIWLIRECAAR